MPDFNLSVNGAARTVNVEPDTPLLYVLRNDLELNAHNPTFNDVPAVDVHIINMPNERSLGVGEGSQGPTVAAIANAIANATGKRMRDLPFTPEKVRAITA